MCFQTFWLTKAKSLYILAVAEHNAKQKLAATFKLFQTSKRDMATHAILYDVTQTVAEAKASTTLVNIGKI